MIVINIAGQLQEAWVVVDNTPNSKQSLVSFFNFAYQNIERFLK